jgi:hypothetical protein
MGRSVKVESESSQCPSEGSISWSQTESNATIEADSTIAWLAHPCQENQDNMERTVEVID